MINGSLTSVYHDKTKYNSNISTFITLIFRYNSKYFVIIDILLIFAI